MMTALAMKKAPQNSLQGDTVFIVDDDPAVRDSLCWLVESVGLRAQAFDSALGFLENCDPTQPGCLVLDVRMQQMSGLELQKQLPLSGFTLPVIFITGHGDIPMAVHALKAGAFDFITKPLNDQALLERIQNALEKDKQQRQRDAKRRDLEKRIKNLTKREHQVLVQVVSGCLNKVIAANLHLSIKTVEVHRAKVMEKMAVRNVAELIHAAILCGIHPSGKPNSSIA